MKRLGCKVVSQIAIEQIKNETEIFVSKGNKAPALAVILVGNNPASETYVRNKTVQAEAVGFVHFQYNLSVDCEEQELLGLIDELNAREDIDGILVQLPLPKHLSEKKVIDRISPEKDVDGFSAISVGRLCQGDDTFVPCTPLGIMDILKYYEIETVGKRVVVIGRSNIVGKPMAMLLMQRGIDATVTVCNTKTPDLKEYTKNADIIIVAAGCPNTIDESYVKDGATVIDVGVNRIEDPTKEKGFHLEGDANYESFKDIDVAITPVPGGVGLMTVAMLMKNTLKSAIKRRGI